MEEIVGGGESGWRRGDKKRGGMREEEQIGRKDEK